MEGYLPPNKDQQSLKRYTSNKEYFDMKKILIIMAAMLALAVLGFAQITPPYAEAFDGVTAPAMPAGWTVLNENADTVLWETSTSGYNSAPNCLRISYNSSADMDDWAITPALNLTAGTYNLEFKYRASGYDEQLAVCLGTAATVAAMGTPLTDLIFDSSTYATASVVVTVATDGTYYLGFHGHSDADQFYMCVDDISLTSVSDPPSAAITPSPADSATNVSINPILTWVSGGGAPTDYDVYFATAAAGLPSTANANVLDPTWTPGTLLYDTAYVWKIVPHNSIGYCSTGIVTWGFTTMSDPTITSFPYNQNFDDTWSGTPAAPLGWTVINANNDSYLWSQADTYITPRSAPYTAHGMGNTNDYLITPPIDLTGVDVRMKWWDIVESASQANSYKVLLSTTDTQIASFTVELGDITCTNTAWTEHTINLNGYTGTVYLAFYQYASAATYYGFGIDDFLLEEIPAGPAISVSPTTWDFGDVDIVAPATKVFTITNTGAADLILSNVTANGAYYSITAQPDMTVTPGNSTTFTVQFAPTEVGGPYTGDITINDNRAQTVITLTGSAIARPAGSTCGNPYDVTLPLVNFAGDTALYGDDYDSGWVTPSSNYLTGDDMVLRFTLALPSTLSGSISTTASWPGLLIVGQEPNATTPAPLLASATTSGTSATMTPVVLPAGTYFAIVSSYTSPQSIPFTLNLSAVPLSNDPEPSEYPTAFTFGTTATTSIQLTWTGSVGTQLPSKYLILAKKAGGTFATVTDGIPVANDAVWTDNNAAINVAHVVGANTYTFTGLTEATSYDFVIYPYTNELGNTNYKTDGTAPAFTKETVDPNVPMPLPYVQDFNSGTSLANINWTGDMYISSTHGNNGTNGLTRNMYSYNNTGNVVSCFIGPMVANAELKFDYRIVDYTGYPATATAITTDTIEAQVSTDGGLNFTTVYTVNQGNHVTSNAFATVTIPLAAYNTGNVKVKLLSTWGAGDYYVDIDNVMVRESPVGPPDAVTLVSPVDNAEDMHSTGFDLTWAPALTGGTPTSYTVYMASSAETIYEEEAFNDISGTSFNPVTDGLMSFNYEERWFWTVEAINDDGSAVVDPPISFTIEAAPLIISTLPYGTDFEAHADNTLPLGWERSSLSVGWVISDDYSSEYWTIPAHTVYAAANDDAAGSSGDGSMDLLITPLLDFSGTGALGVQMKFDSFYTGDYSYVATVEISVAGGAWTNIFTVPATSAWATYAINLSSYAAAPFQIRFHGNDSGSWSSGWAIDDVIIKELPNYDVEVVSIDMEEVYAPESLTPKATVINNGINTAPFTVTMEIGDAYTDVQQVTALATGLTQQVSFTPMTPELYQGYNVTVTVALTGDEVPENDEKSSAFYCLPIDKQAYGDDAYLGDGPVSFNLKSPGTLTDLPSANPFTTFLAGADWMNGSWYGVENNDTNAAFWQVDPITGAGTQIGLTGFPGFTGVTYDSNHDILYGCTSSSLYTINPTTGAATLVAVLNAGDWTVYMLSIAYDTWQDKLYAHDIAYDALFEIDLTTNTIAPATGFTYGPDFNYQQDLAFDRETGMLYLAGSVVTAGALYWIHPADASAWKIGDFQDGTLVAGFAIPYSDELPIPQLSIAADGTLSWTDVGASNYKIYGSDEPYSGFTVLATVSTTSWLDPNFPQAKKFYYVTSADSAKRVGTDRAVLNSMQSLKRGERLNRNAKKVGNPLVNSERFTPKTK